MNMTVVKSAVLVLVPIILMFFVYGVLSHYEMNKFIAQYLEGEFEEKRNTILAIKAISSFIFFIIILLFTTKYKKYFIVLLCSIVFTTLLNETVLDWVEYENEFMPNSAAGLIAVPLIFVHILFQLLLVWILSYRAPNRNS